MTRTIEINENIIQEALEFEENLTENELVEKALLAYIKRQKQKKIIELFGTIEYEDNYDYKQQRQI